MRYAAAMPARVVVAALAILIAAVHGCSDDEQPSSVQAASTSASSVASTGAGGAGGKPEPCFDYAAFAPDAGVSFADDVMPIFEQHCNSATCHGSTTSPDGDLYLGRNRNNDEVTLDAVHANLVDVDATRAPAMKRVAPGDAEHSFLMVKLDGDFACPQVECGTLGCGVKMPNGAAIPKLDIAVRQLIRSWIQNGAPRSDTSAGGAGGSGGR